MGHDQRFKEFLQLFLRDFLKLFCPEVEERLDFETLELIDKELFTDFPEGSPREADVVAKLRNREGSPEIVLIHVEIQSRSERDFEVRMFGVLRHALATIPAPHISHRGVSSRRQEGADHRGIPDGALRRAYKLWNPLMSSTATSSTP